MVYARFVLEAHQKPRSPHYNLHQMGLYGRGLCEGSGAWEGIRMKFSLRKRIALTLALVLLCMPMLGPRVGSGQVLGGARAESADTPTGGDMAWPPADDNAPDQGAAKDDSPSKEHLSNAAVFSQDGGDGNQDVSTDADAAMDGGADNPDGDILPDGGADNPDGDILPDGGADNPDGDILPDGGADNPDGDVLPDGGAVNLGDDAPADVGAQNPEGESMPDASSQPETLESARPSAADSAPVSKAALATGVLIGGLAESEARINLNASVKILRLTAQVTPPAAPQAVKWTTSNKKVA
jgi:hypothetical protein